MLLIIFSIPAIQTTIADKVTHSINETYGTSISIKRISLKYNGNALIKQVYIKDHHQDTLIYSKEVETSLLSIRALVNNQMNLGYVHLNGAKLFVKKYAGEENDNLYVFSQKFNTGKPSATPFKLSSSEVELSDMHFRFTDEDLDSPVVVDYKNLHLLADNFKLNDVEVTAQINDLQLDADRGYNLRGLQTDFKYNPDEIVLNDMILSTEHSVIRGDAYLDTREDAFQDFNNRVNFDIDFAQSEISTTDLQAFYSEFGADHKILLSGKMLGTLNDFTVTNFDLAGFSNSRILGDVRFRRLLGDDNTFTIEGDYGQLKTNYLDLTALLPNILGTNLPEELVRLGTVDLNGIVNFTENTVYTKSIIQTNLGFLETDIDLQNTQNMAQASYVGMLQGKAFHMGRLLKVPELGTMTFNMRVNGSGVEAETLDTRLEGIISNVTYQGYTYKGITVSGNLKNPIFDGKLSVRDPNADFTFDGLVDVSEEIHNYDFTAEINRIDLGKLHFLKDSSAVLKGKVVMDMRGTNIDDTGGVISFTDASFENANDLYEFQDFVITSGFRRGIRTITMNSPDIISGQVSGQFKIGDVRALFQNAIGSLYTNYEPQKITENQFMDFDIQIYSKIVEVLVPDVELEPDTYVRGSVVSDDSDFKLTFRSPRIKAYGVLAEAINVRVDNKNPLFNAYVEADSIGSGLYGVSDFNLINVTLKDTLFVRSEFKGGPDKQDVFDLSFYHTINEENNSVVGFKKSSLKFKNNLWWLNEADNKNNKVVFDNNFMDWDIKELILSHNQERISLEGVVRDSTFKDIKTNFESVRLSHIMPYVDSLDMRGLVNGNLDILQKEGVYLPNSTVNISNFTVNEILMGDLDLSVSGNESLTSYDINTRLINEDVEVLTALGTINVNKETPAIDLDVQMRKLNLKAFSPLGGEVISSIRGLASGRASVTGDYRNPDIDGEILLREAGLAIPYLNTNYDFKGTARISLSDQEFRFGSVALADTKYKTTGTLSGTISHQFFRDWELDLDVNTDRLLVLDTEPDDFALYYGTAFISGGAQLRGPTDELVIDVEATTEEGTVFKIPLSDTESFGDNSKIYFLSPEEKAARLKGEEVVIEEIKGLELNFDLEVTRDAEVEIVVDEVNGSTLKGRGAGFLLIQINTNGKFNMFGDFTPYQGSYNFRYSGVVQKQFDILPEGKISWDGNPTEALLDISAVYKTQANPSVLLDNPSINRKIPVSVIINLDGELVQPEITFDFEFPNTSSIVTSELSYRLDNRATRELQAFSLVTQGSFFSQNGIDAQSAAYGNLIETASGIFNDLLSDDDGKFNVGLDYVQADNRPDLQTSGRFGFTLSTQISQKVIINGKVGVPVGGVSEQAVVGDVEVNFLLNEDGSLRATIFNRQTDIQFVARNNEGYTQGAGLSYSVDFNTFKELIQKIFKGKAREVEEEIKVIQPDSEIPYNGLEQ
ncbi:translocation/assembly module TamB domain-containing protein [Leeuwenhoekiella marinoflava]|uniref:translocation/assembly module TamB domain-containing protein n=1 Tax=Leeuwenhoekiella marinoflava TaxID=988 RepID=UPI003002258F